MKSIKKTLLLLSLLFEFICNSCWRYILFYFPVNSVFAMQDTKHSKKNKPRSASELRLDEATVQGIYRKPDEELIIGNKGSDAEFKPEYSIIPIRKNFDDRLAYDQEPESFHREHGQMGEPIFINEIENALQEIEEISTHETTSKDQRRR